ncbi:diacylglycerol/lipid kinase family protein [Sphingobium sufflavum]|uniref:diacylglycerol/lipid kinase family protein n=1 Tax=Sphingobium sufflavum TaxID=1129547 RepID=UPI001F33243F|nr:diacylglycerol kinase family protein [Sphingobium sufflavum]
MVHNPNAGTEPEPIEPLIADLEEAGYAITYCEHGKDDIAAASAGMELIIAAGGDGTVTSAASEISDRSVPIAILPLGGSNNIARALGIRQSTCDIIAGLGKARERKLTIGTILGPFGMRAFVEAVGLGALNDAIEMVDEDPETPEEKRENGRVAFRDALAGAAPFDCDVDIDGTRFEGPWLLIEVLNIAAIGPRLPFAPRADPGDNVLDVLLVKASDRLAMTTWAEHFSGPPPARIEGGCRILLKGQAMRVRIDDRPLDLPGEPWTIELHLDETPVTVLVPGERKEEPA